jgi:hypothetical protein
VLKAVEYTRINVKKLQISTKGLSAGKSQQKKIEKASKLS